jgi:WD40 repeat protein
LNPVVLRGHEGPVYRVAVSPDKRWVVTGSEDHTARLWLFQVNDLFNLTRNTVGRNFSMEESKLFFPVRSTARPLTNYQVSKRA